MGDHERMVFTTELAEGSPDAPSPTAATTKLAPGAGVVPEVIVGELVFGGTTVIPLANMTVSLVELVWLPLLMTADTERL